MKAKDIKRASFADGVEFAFKKMEEWLKKNPEADVLNISNYCDNNNARYIIIHYKDN